MYFYLYQIKNCRMMFCSHKMLATIYTFWAASKHTLLQVILVGPNFCFFIVKLIFTKFHLQFFAYCIWSHRIHAWTRAKHFSALILSVILLLWKFTFRSSNMNIVFSTVTSLSPLMGKLFSIILLYLESHTRFRKLRKLEKQFFLDQ